MAPDVTSDWVPLPTNSSYEIHPTEGVRSVDRVVVRRIKELCSLGESDTNVAKTFNISRAAVYKIRLGKAWKHLM